MNQINNKKFFNFKNENIEIRLIYITNNNTDLDKINLLLNDFIHNHRKNYMVENVTIIRTILKDCKEQLLEISYKDKMCSETVRYYNNDLILYEKTKSEDNNNDLNKYTIKYEQPYGIKLDYNNCENNMIDYQGTESLSKEINDIIKQIYNLKNTKPIVLSTEDKVLIEIYKLFYNENPNFNNKDINIKIQSMVFILKELGISLTDNYEFKISQKEQMPLSLNLQQKINKLYPLGELNVIEDTIKLTKDSKKIVKIIGKTIIDKLPKEQNRSEALKKISNSIYYEKYTSSYNCTKEVSQFNENNDNEINSENKLIKHIKTKTNNN